MGTVTGSNKDNTWDIHVAYSGTLNGLDGVDTLNVGTLKRSDFTLNQDINGNIVLDTVSSASSKSSHVILENMEILKYDSNKYSIDLNNYFLKIVESMPLDNSSNIPQDSELTFKFNRIVKPGSGNITIHEKSATGPIYETFQAAANKLISFSQDTITVIPSKILIANTHYFVTFDNSAILDEIGNKYLDNTGYDFTTRNDNNHIPKGIIEISGQTKQGATLKASNTLMDEDGLGKITYQWLRDGDFIVGANKATYKLTLSDVGKHISVNATYTDKLGTLESVTSEKSTPNIASLKASSGGDFIIGTNKADKINGLAGNDTLIGSLGKDTLTGGKGSDIFKFQNVFESGYTTDTCDIITDFSSSEGDKIDILEIQTDAPFRFIGSEKFSTDNASGQIRFDETSHMLYGSINADSSPEFAILLIGIQSLSANNIILV